MDQYELHSSSTAWDFFVKVSFVIANSAPLVGIYLLPGALVVKGYVLFSSLFLVFASITLSKTVRDRHESDRLHNKISEARTSKMLRDMDTE